MSCSNQKHDSNDYLFWNNCKKYTDQMVNESCTCKNQSCCSQILVEPRGPPGPTGPTGTIPTFAYGNFYIGFDIAIIAGGSLIDFSGIGPANNVSRMSAGIYSIPNPGMYYVSFILIMAPDTTSVSVQAILNSVPVENGLVNVSYSDPGGQVASTFIISVPANSMLSLMAIENDISINLSNLVIIQIG